jgi:DNA repair exonuclease SbcCD nuclease subunit
VATKPIAVLIADLHFTVSTLELASTALQMAMDKAFELGIPLVLAGDTLDGKAIIRAECSNKLLSLFRMHSNKIFRKWGQRQKVYLIDGNHDKLNEKADDSALEFLHTYCDLISHSVPIQVSSDLAFIPYQANPDTFRACLSVVEKYKIIICHQGLVGASMGHYVQDKSAITLKDVEGYRIISGHYHARQDIENWSYIGNPYTLSFGEARDPEKGFQILHSDGVLEFIPTKLRKHVVIDAPIELVRSDTALELSSGDWLWLRIRGPKVELDQLSKCQIANKFGLSPNFKLDLIPIEDTELVLDRRELSDSELLDKIIDNTKETKDTKKDLKKLWREVIE